MWWTRSSWWRPPLHIKQSVYLSITRPNITQFSKQILLSSWHFCCPHCCKSQFNINKKMQLIYLPEPSPDRKVLRKLVLRMMSSNFIILSEAEAVDVGTFEVYREVPLCQLKQGRFFISLLIILKSF